MGGSLDLVEIYHCGITSVDIFEGATIEKMDVWECQELSTVNVPGYVSEFEIERCDSVSSLTIHEQLESLTVYGLPNLYMDSFNIPSALKKLVLQGVNISSIDIPNTCESCCFSYCTLNTATIEPGRTKLTNCMFMDCDNLTSVNIPNGVTTIGDLAFAYCDNLTNVEIPDSVNHIGLSHRPTAIILLLGGWDTVHQFLSFRRLSLVVITACF